MRTHGRHIHTPGRAKKVGLTALAIGGLGMVSAVASWSAFSATTENPANEFETGTVVIGDNDSDVAMFDLQGLAGDDTHSRCIKVSYTGTMPAEVSLYGTTGGTGLDAYLDLTVTRGAYSPTDDTFSDCTNFVADSTTYIAGQAAGVVYTGTLEGFADDFDSGVVDPTAGSPESWTNPESHVYKFTVTVRNDAEAQGLNATQTFTWEARTS